MALLSENQIRERLARVPGWERRGNEIRRTWTFADFESSMSFVNKVAALAQAADHHPDIDIRYSKVTLALSTHDAGGLTARDFDLAEAIGA
jgi:4a-hydroxytetrahydrobiopterin dehydratase